MINWKGLVYGLDDDESVIDPAGGWGEGRIFFSCFHAGSETHPGFYLTGRLI
jgi:hypothetical protein